MPAVTPAYVKNMIRRSFSELVDEGPDRKEQALIWSHFNAACAYCCLPLRKEAKEGHIDHLVSASKGGANALGNRVLSCATCNEKQKLDQPWEAFLRLKAPSPEEFGVRRKVIVEWQRLHPTVDDMRLRDLKNAAQEHAKEVIALFDRKVAETRELRRVMTRL